MLAVRLESIDFSQSKAKMLVIDTTVRVLEFSKCNLNQKALWSKQKVAFPNNLGAKPCRTWRTSLYSWFKGREEMSWDTILIGIRGNRCHSWTKKSIMMQVLALLGTQSTCMAVTSRPEAAPCRNYATQEPQMSKRFSPGYPWTFQTISRTRQRGKYFYP